MARRRLRQPRLLFTEGAALRPWCALDAELQAQFRVVPRAALLNNMRQGGPEEERKKDFTLATLGPLRSPFSRLCEHPLSPRPIRVAAPSGFRWLDSDKVSRRAGLRRLLYFLAETPSWIIITML